MCKLLISELRASALPRHLRAGLLCMAGAVEEGNFDCWLGRREQARRQRVSERQVQYSRAEAVRLGVLERIELGHRGRHCCYRFQLARLGTACAVPAGARQLDLWPRNPVPPSPEREKCTSPFREVHFSPRKIRKSVRGQPRPLPRSLHINITGLAPPAPPRRPRGGVGGGDFGR